MKLKERGVSSGPRIAIPVAVDKRLRVGMLLPVWCCGGVERYHLALARASKRIRWVGAAFTTNSASLPDMVHELAEVMPVHGDGTMAGQGVGQSDRIHFHGSEQAAIDAVARRCDVLLVWGIQDLRERLKNVDVPIVVISHGECGWTRATLVGASPSATHYAAVSEAAKTAFPVGVLDRVKVVGTGVELERVAPSRSRGEIRAEVGIDAAETVVGFVGRFSPEKRPLIPARIVGQLGEGHTALYHGLYVHGEDQFRRDATNAASGRIRFCGREHHLGDMLAAMDCLIISSEHEGGPLVAIEAWMTGVPVVSTPVGIVAKHGEEYSTIVPHEATIPQWAAVVGWTLRNKVGPNAMCVAETYSAAALARRWETWLYEVNANVRN